MLCIQGKTGGAEWHQLAEEETERRGGERQTKQATKHRIPVPCLCYTYPGVEHRRDLRRNVHLRNGLATAMLKPHDSKAIYQALSPVL